MKKFLAALACVVLSGCVAPPMVTYVSIAMDGASFAATGKSVGDHALSAMTDEDCALLRVVTEQDVEAVCQEYASEEEREAAMAPTVVTAFKTMFTEIEGDQAPPPPYSAPPFPQPVAMMEGLGETVATQTSTGNQSAIYLMIGNFSSFGGAEQLAAKVTGISAVVAPAMAGDNLYFRVVAGPISASETDAAQARLISAGIDNSWAANLCMNNLGAPPCDSD